MPFDPIVMQTVLAIPMTLGLVIYSLLRWEKAALHTLLAVLLTSTTVWLAGIGLKAGGSTEWLRLVGLHLEVTAVIFMPPLFLVTMAYFARSPLFEQNMAPSIALLSISGLFFLGYVTDSQHHLFFTDQGAALAGEAPSVWGGPLFWASQLWTAVADLAAFAYCANVLVRGPSRTERMRAAMVFTAVAFPTAAHALHLLSWTPFDYSLAPGSLAFTALFLVQGVHRYGLMGGQTIIRHDLLEHLYDGLVLADAHGVVLDANAAAEKTLGRTRADLRGLSLPYVLAALGKGRAGREIGDQVLALPLDGGRVSAALSTSDGRMIEVSGGAVPALGSQPAGRFVSLQDRTDQRRNERLLRERQKLESVGVLAAGVAHEVNNPLAYVRANLVHLANTAEQLAKCESPSHPAEAAEMPDVLTESIEGLDRIAKIVQGMLRFSRTPDEAHRAIDLHPIVDEALRLASLQRGSTVRAKAGPETLPRILGSHERLVQVLLNLFLNAKQATKARGDAQIEAQIRLDGGHIVVDVRDNGPGIPPELQERVFDPFFTTRGPDEGTGLGLSIAFDIVREHGGQLELSSQPGVGTCFSLRLPVEPPNG